MDHRALKQLCNQWQLAELSLGAHLQPYQGALHELVWSCYGRVLWRSRCLHLSSKPIIVKTHARCLFVQCAAGMPIYFEPNSISNREGRTTYLRSCHWQLNVITTRSAKFWRLSARSQQTSLARRGNGHGNEGRCFISFYLLWFLWLFLTCCCFCDPPPPPLTTTNPKLNSPYLSHRTSVDGLGLVCFISVSIRFSRAL